MIAIAADVAVGVDVEGPVSAERAARLAPRFLTPEESEPDVFLRGWTAREAVAKALGRPLVRCLDTRVETDLSKPLALTAAPSGAPPPHEWSLHELALTEGRETVVVAVPRPGVRLTRASAYPGRPRRSAGPSAR